MKLGYTLIYVQDVAKTGAFYQKAFGLSVKFAAESGLYIEMETGSTSLGFVDEALVKNSGAQFTPNRAGAPAAGFEIAFVTDDVQAAVDHAVISGATLLAPPEQRPWGQLVAYVADLNGVIVEICSPM